MKRIYSIPLVIGLLVALLLLVEFYGFPISGTEFSAQTFTRRSFSYRRGPFTKTLRSKRVLKTIELGCESMETLSLIPPPSKTPQRWDLVSESLQDDHILSGEFDARFLTAYIDWKTNDWNTENVEKAELFWPEIADLAREGQYLSIPSLFEIAFQSPDEESNEEFENRLKRNVAKAWYEAAGLLESDNAELLPGVSGENLATRFFEKAFSLDPGLRNKAESHENDLSRP